MSQPNFIVYLTDDQGYGDLSCMGAPDFRTPHLDRLAADGARFSNWYSNSSVCSPARAALLTGRYPGNAGVRAILGGHRYASGLLPSVPTLAKALQPLGYSTCLSGKWHLGVIDECRPHQHGFDHWFGFLAGCIDYYSHIFYWQMNTKGHAQIHDLWQDNRHVWRNGEYFTEMIAKEAIAYIREAAAAGRPFFLYVPFNAPHYPMHAPAEYLARFPDLPWDRQIMAAMISAVDDAVGAITAEVERLGLADNTVSFFTSDNGPSRESRNWLDDTPDPYHGGTTGGFRGHKFSLFEGGVRVPGILHFPGKVPAGQVIDQPCASMDVFPTLLRLAGGNPDDYELDGTDLMPLVAGGANLPERPIFWELANQTAVRLGPWKLVLNGRLEESEGVAAPVFLANLDDDPYELTNLADSEPEKVTELTALAERWSAGIEARWETEFEPARQAITAHYG